MMTRRMFVMLAAGLAFLGTVLAAPEPTPEKTSGQIVGEIVKKDGGKITVKGEHETLNLMPYWRGGMPKDGGGFDKDMLRKLEGFKVGDKVRVSWKFEEHYRIETIERIGGEHRREEKPAEPRGQRTGHD